MAERRKHKKRIQVTPLRASQTSDIISSGTTRKGRVRVRESLLSRAHRERGGVHGLQVKPEDG